MTFFADNAPNKLAENRSALSTPDTSSVAKCSRLTTSGQSAHLASGWDFGWISNEKRHRVVRPRRGEDEVNTVGHQTVRPYLDSGFTSLLGEQIAINVVVPVLEKYSLPPAPALGHVMRKAGTMRARRVTLANYHKGEKGDRYRVDASPLGTVARALRTACESRSSRLAAISPSGNRPSFSFPQERTACTGASSTQSCPI